MTSKIHASNAKLLPVRPVRLGLSAFCLLIGLFAPAPAAWAQTARITGQVTDAETGTPIPGVNVVIEGTQRGASTNAEGYYSIINIDPGTYTLRASFIGYADQVVEDVGVDIGLTTQVDFALQQETFGLEEVVVQAETPVIQKDVSGTQRNISAEELQAAPYQSVESVINAQVGVNSTSVSDDRPEIRGGGLGTMKFIVDGVEQGDPLTNRPHLQVNLEAVKAVKVQTGGFSAQYGNARSGVVNVVTKDGGDVYSGSVNFQYSPPGLKHFGPMMYGFESPVVRPFVSREAGAFSGNDFFDGWKAIANERLEPGQPHYGKPMELYARYLWRHRSQDAIDELQRLKREGLVDIEFAAEDPDALVFHQYGTRPDWNAGVTFGGPVPFTGKHVHFFTSFSGTSKEYARLFSSQPTYEDRSVRAKVTADIAPGMKLRLKGYWNREIGGDGGQGPGITGWVSSDPFRALGATNKLWYPNCAVAGQQTRQYYGIEWTHTLSSNTFYEVQFTYHRADYEMLQDLRDTAPIPGTNGITTAGGAAGVIEGRIGTTRYADSLAAAGAPGWENWRDWAEIKIGEYWYDESPEGYGPVNWRDVTGYYRMESCNLRTNNTYTRGYDLEARVLSQVNRHNQVHAGIQLRRDRIYQYYKAVDPSVNGGSVTKSDAVQWTGALFVEDKIEYEGFVANLGLRLDGLLTAPFPLLNGEGRTGPYSEVLLAGNTGQDILEKLPTERTLHLRLSPRLGISHPISDIGKVFFNYGHFYQWPQAFDLYQVQYDTRSGNRVDNLGNPTLEPARTIAYELGYVQNLFDRASLSLTGYYKDINNEIDDATYYPLGRPGYERQVNIAYSDVRGLEALLELRRDAIPFVSGWVSANYFIESGAEFGFEQFYENPIQQPGYSNTEVSNPDVRPIVKANLNVHTPEGFGPSWGEFSLLGGININLLYTWQRGEQFTWNPADVPLVEDNLRWRPYQRWDLRFQKALYTKGRFASMLYIDVTNLFNTRNMTHPGGYYRGGWAWDGHRWFKNQFQQYMESLGYGGENQDADSGNFDTEHRPGDWKGEGIDLPDFTPWTFLERRNIYFGVKLRF